MTSHLGVKCMEWMEMHGNRYTTSGLQIFGKLYEMTFLTSRIWQNPNVFRPKKDFKITLMSYDK